MARLGELDYVTKVYPSDANFVLFQMKAHAQQTYKIVSEFEALYVMFLESEVMKPA